MGQSYRGVSQNNLIQAQENILEFAKINREHHSMKDVDLNNELQQIQIEYSQYFQQQIALQQERMNSTSYQKDLNEDQLEIQFDPKNQISNENLFVQNHPENYIHQNDFSTSELKYESDLQDIESKQKPKLLMIHGFGATGLIFYKLIGFLRKFFRITTIDFLGMGASGRPPFNLSTGRDSIEYFIHSIEAWIRSTKYRDDCEDFYLLGHSLGGNISVHYALRYPQKIKQLILLSPVGVPFKLVSQPQQNRGCLFRMVGSLWDSHMSPFAFLRGMGYYPASSFLTSYVRRRMIINSNEEVLAVKELFQQVTTRDQSSEISISMILKMGAWARDPLEYKMKDLKMAVHFYYGENDWMRREIADKLLNEGHLKNGSLVITIPKSGHQLFIDNATDCALEIIGSVLGVDAKNQLAQQISPQDKQQDDKQQDEKQKDIQLN